MPTPLLNVRYRVRSGKHLLAASISAFDPKPSAAPQHSVDNRPDQWRLLVRADFVSGLARDRPIQWEGMQRSCSQNWDRVIFSDAAISMKSGLFETLQHVVVRCLRAELRGKPLSV